MMHRALSSIVEVPYCFSRSYVKFQGHTALKIVEFDPNWAFPDCNSSLNTPMAMKCCTKLETAKERCPIVFQGHPSNFKVTRDKTSPILTQIGRFRTLGRSQFSNPSDLPCWIYIATWRRLSWAVFSVEFWSQKPWYMDHMQKSVHGSCQPCKHLCCHPASHVLCKRSWRRLRDCLIFIMRTPMLLRQYLYIETAAHASVKLSVCRDSHYEE